MALFLNSTGIIASTDQILTNSKEILINIEIFINIIWDLHEYSSHSHKY